MRRTKENKGITLIALMVTVIILLILAGTSIGILTGDSGIIKNVQNSKEQTEISEEKEAINVSATKAIGKDKFGNLSDTQLERELKNYTGKENIVVYKEDEIIYVTFSETNRTYEVDADNKVELYIPYVDTTPGELAQDENGYYKVESIEDLLALSIMTNGGYSDENVNIPSKHFSSSDMIIMTRDLDFLSSKSYDNSKTTKYNKYFGITDTSVTLMEVLTNTSYQGFIPIGKTGSTSIAFVGIFDGRNCTIKNIYINATDYAGLFGYARYSTIKNVTITGNIKGTSYTGGILGRMAEETTIENCVNRCTISSTSTVGGIVGGASSTNSTVKNCINEANLEGNSNTGGIIGATGLNGTVISNCYNSGNVTNGDTGGAGGIAGDGTTSTIMNCYNTKDATITSTGKAGGIVGSTSAARNINIYNCYNLGKVNATAVGGILGYLYHSTVCVNCYNGGTLTGTTVGGMIGSALWNNTSENLIKNNFYLKTSSVTKGVGKNVTDTTTGIDAFTQETIDVLNSYITSNDDAIDTTNWSVWSLSGNSYIQ